MERMDRAVVVGASAGGILAAQMLSKHAREIVVVERDALPTEANARRGVPQALHLHALLTRGQKTIERYFPGVRDELLAAGATKADSNRDIAWLGPYGFRPRVDGPGATSLWATRSFIDATLVRRLRANEAVRVRESTRVVGLTSDGSASVRGVELESGEVIEADLVVDATGRGSFLPKWLGALGTSAPEETIVDARIGYASALVRLRRPLPNDWRVAFVFGTPTVPRYGVLANVEGNRSMMTLVAVGDVELPKTEEDAIRFAKTLRCPLVHDAVRDAEWLTPIATTRSTVSRRRHYAKQSLPRRILPIGDSVCAFNPIYGQGITVAGLEVEALDERLSSAPNVDVALERARRDFERIIDAVWSMATSEDFRYPHTTGPRPFGLSFVHGYLDRLFAASVDDPELLRAFDVSFHLEDFGRALVTPRMVWKALRAKVPTEPLDEVPVP